MDIVQHPPKLCECGCGEQTPLANQTSTRDGWVRNQPIRFISGHNRRIQSQPPEPKCCECGCGQFTPIADSTNTRAGWVKGQPLRFIRNHSSRVQYDPPEERFWAKVDRSGGPVACWPWTGSHGAQGYGQIWIDGRQVLTHRYAYELDYGPIPSGMSVCHKCDNPPCCNSAHYFIGDKAANARDAINKGRNVRGERVGGVKLTSEQVGEAREVYARGATTYTDLARAYGVSRNTLSAAIKRQSWQHVE